jgi:hypothetical protein
MVAAVMAAEVTAVVAVSVVVKVVSFRLLK